MQYSQKYTLVSFIKPVDEGAEFAMVDWPPHVTIADIFAIDRLNSAIDSKLGTLLGSQSQVISHATSDVTLGIAAVVLIDKNDALTQLHSRVIKLLASNGAVFNNPEFTYAGFLPHCTIQKTGRLHTDDPVAIDTVSLIDMFPDGNWQRRKVLRTFALRS